MIKFFKNLFFKNLIIYKKNEKFIINIFLFKKFFIFDYYYLICSIFK
jgi:hypothetical protein